MESALSFLPSAPFPDLRAVRINLTYLWRHRRLPDLEVPEKFTEHVQYRKLHDRDVRLPILADKVAVKEAVAQSIGSEWVIPTLWHGTELPPKPEWPLPFVLKARHGCNQSIFVHSDAGNWDHIRQKTARWVAGNYGFWLDEWLYSHIPRGLLVEPFIGTNDALPVDYKFFVFGGRAEFVQVHLDRAGRHRWIVFDRHWRRASSPSSDADPAPPRNLARMMEAAETLGHGFDFVRVDMYEVGDRPLFGEMTFYPGSGLHRLDPVSLDDRMGELWTQAKACRIMKHGPQANKP